YEMSSITANQTGDIVTISRPAVYRFVIEANVEWTDLYAGDNRGRIDLEVSGTDESLKDFLNFDIIGTGPNNHSTIVPIQSDAEVSLRFDLPSQIIIKA